MKRTLQGRRISAIFLALGLTACGVDLRSPVSATSAVNYQYFVFTQNSGSISAFKRNDDGSLTEAPNSPVAIANLQSMKVAPNGQYLYVVRNGAADVIQSYSIDPSTGELTLSDHPAPATGASPGSTIFHPSGEHFYLSETATNNLRHYSVNTTSGAISYVGQAASGNNVGNLDISPDGKHVYADRGGSYDVFDLASGVPTFNAGKSPQVIAANSRSKVWNEAGDVMYLAHASTDLKVYSYTAGTAALTEIDSEAVVSCGFDVALTSDGAYLVASDTCSANDARLMRVDPGDGRLTDLSTISFGGTAAGVWIGPQDHVYIADPTDDEIEIYLINRGTEQMNFVTTVSAGSGTTALYHGSVPK